MTFWTNVQGNPQGVAPNVACFLMVLTMTVCDHHWRRHIDVLPHWLFAHLCPDHTADLGSYKIIYGSTKMRLNYFPKDWILPARSGTEGKGLNAFPTSHILPSMLLSNVQHRVFWRISDIANMITCEEQIDCGNGLNHLRETGLLLFKKVVFTRCFGVKGISIWLWSNTDTVILQ